MADILAIPTTAKQELIDLINHDNGTQLKVDDVSFSTPVVVDYVGRNTKVTVTANPDSKYKGSMAVYYNRLALSDVGYIGIITASPLATDEFLSMVSVQKSIEFLAEEFEDFSMPVLEVGQVGEVTLVAKENAIKWYGQTQVEYAFALPPEIATLHELIHVTLSAPGYLT